MDARHRRRSTIALFAGVAASAMGYTMLVAVLPLAAEDLLGSPLWSGAPSALGTTGVAFGTSWLAALTLRRGRRRALALGYWGAALAACVAAAGAALAAFVLMAASIFIFGAGYAANRLSRYAAAELGDPSQRSAAIGWNVWAATVGAVVGPLLLDPTRRASAAAGLPADVGPFLVAAAVFLVSGLVLWLLFTDPERIEAAPAHAAAETAASRQDLRLAAVSLVVAQVVMILVMTMTPLHIRHNGQGYDTIGVVFASHTFGMYALSPVAGLLSDRFGRVPMIVAACAMLAVSTLMAAASGAGSTLLALAMFLLGLGWCFSFVAGSALLTESVSPARRVRIQGGTDSLIWGSAAVAGLTSGVLLFAVGYARLGQIGAVVSLVPLLFLRRQPSLSTPEGCRAERSRDARAKAEAPSGAKAPGTW